MNRFTAVQVVIDVDSRKGEGWLPVAFPNRGFGVADTVVLGNVLAGDGGAVLAAPRPLRAFGHLITSFKVDSLHMNKGSVTHDTVMDQDRNKCRNRLWRGRCADGD